LISSNCTCNCLAGYIGAACSKGFYIGPIEFLGNSQYNFTIKVVGSFYVGDQLVLAKEGAQGFNSKGEVIEEGHVFICRPKTKVNLTHCPKTASNITKLPLSLTLTGGSYVLYYNKNLGYNEAGVDNGYKLDENNPSKAKKFLPMKTPKKTIQPNPPKKKPTNTPTPKKKPTNTPTPIKKPVKNPTKKPTNTPTPIKKPVKNPTKKPVTKPVKNPTKKPAKKPVTKPNKKPAKKPANKQ